MKKNLLILMTLCVASIGYSQTFTSNNIEYNVLTPTTVEITGYTTTGGDINILSTVTNSSITYSVTNIKFLAFQNKGLTSVIIPNSVTDIGIGAFSGNSLLSVILGNSITNIGASAFFNNQITNLIIPNSVTTIGVNAFQNSPLTSLVIGNSVTSIGNWAFYGNQLTSVTIPNSVTSIGDVAFSSGNNPLNSVVCLAITPPTITTSSTSGLDTFASNRSTINLHVPSGTSTAYANGGWTGFSSVTEDALSTSNFELENEIIIYNNTIELNIISSNTAILENYTIYSISGSKVKNGTENNIAIDDLSSGIYILELNFDKGRLVKKFVK